MEEETFDVKAVISEIIENQKKLAEDIAEIKASIMDELINPIKDEYSKMQYDNALSDFRCKHAEKLEPFNGKLKALEGDDFDIVKKAFDDFSSRTDGMEEDDYVEKLCGKVSEQLEAIGKAFGVEPEKIEKVEIETKDGETQEVQVDEQEAEQEAEEQQEAKAEAETEAEETDEDNYKKWEDIYKKEVK